MDRRTLKKIRSAGTREKRMNLVFDGNAAVEAMVKRELIEPVGWVEVTAPCSEKGLEEVTHEASQINLTSDEAVLVHETLPELAKSIVEYGFDDPFRRAGENSYHVPGSVRHGRVFCWPHVSTLGKNDISGAVVVCQVNVEDVLVSSYRSFSALETYEFYEWLKESGFHHDKMLAEEYNQYHVFNYAGYIQWVEKGDRETSIDTLFPYRIG